VWRLKGSKVKPIEEDGVACSTPQALKIDPQSVGAAPFERFWSYAICPVCYWEDDPVQNINPNFVGGANRVSLNQATENFVKYWAIEKRLAGYTRAPLEQEPLLLRRLTISL
jgi:hypothetical protein